MLDHDDGGAVSWIGSDGQLEARLLGSLHKMLGQGAVLIPDGFDPQLVDDLLPA